MRAGLTGEGAIKIFIGYDPREHDAYRVAESSLKRRASCPVDVTPLVLERLVASGLVSRLTDRREGIYDLTSNAPASTEFALTRFLVPHLAQTGWALFVDADVVFLGDVAELFAVADPTKAVQVVKHQHTPTGTTKMEGQVQTAYPRKNWSSVMLWNCDHPGNRRLTIHDVNTRRGIELQAYYWLHDSEIGELPPSANWLVGEQERPAEVLIAHFTNGGPWLQSWTPRMHDDIWLSEFGALVDTDPSRRV